MDTKSELTIDIEQSIANAYNTALSVEDQEAVREHLTYILPKLREPNSLIAPIQAALMALQARPSKTKWHEHFLAKAVGAIVLGLLLAGLTKLFGWN